MSSCSAVKWLDDGDSIVIKHEISGLKPSMEEDLKRVIGPKPNRKLLGLFRTNLWVQQRFSRGKSGKFKNGLVSTFGEEPALFRNELEDQNTSRIRTFLNNHGYFNPVIRYEINTKSNGRKTTMHYEIDAGYRHSLRSLTYQSQGYEPDFRIKQLLKSSKIKIGEPYNIKALDELRILISKILRNEGYYFFDKNLIYLEADTVSNSGELNLVLKLKNLQDEYVYYAYVYDSIIINPSFQLGSASTTNLEEIQSYFFVPDEFEYLKKEVILENLILRKNDLFSAEKLSTARRRLYGLNVFRSVNLGIKRVESDVEHKLNLYIDLVPSKKREIIAEAEGNTNNGNSLGISGSLTWKNKNLFQGAEFLELNVQGGVESQQTQLFKGQGNILFNTIEYGLGAKMNLPRFLFPFQKVKKDGLQSYSTSISTNYYNQSRPDYSRSILRAKYGYEWISASSIKFGFFPLEINLGNTNNIDPVFQQALDSINDPFLLFSFSRHLTTSSHFDVTINRLSLSKSNFFFRANVESAGNLLKLAQESTGLGKTDSLFGLPYFQYIRLAADLRKYFGKQKDNYFASRIFLGLGIPLNQYPTLPIEKRYFSGGTNGLRAWQARTIGPGSYNSYQTNVDQFAELKLEANIEWRFVLYKNLFGATFLDAGNIWTLEDTLEQRSDANFNINRFYKEISLGTGFGLRYDLKYFVVRADLGLKLYDPAFNQGNRWIIKNLFGGQAARWRSENWRSQIDPPVEGTDKYNFLNFNLGVGMPF